MEKLGSMPKMELKIDSFDAQPTVNNGITVMIGGSLMIDGSENPLKFAQMFILQQGGAIGYYCKEL